jgi:hypothetical protein
MAREACFHKSGRVAGGLLDASSRPRFALDEVLDFFSCSVRIQRSRSVFDFLRVPVAKGRVVVAGELPHIVLELELTQVFLGARLLEEKLSELGGFA